MVTGERGKTHYEDISDHRLCCVYRTLADLDGIAYLGIEGCQVRWDLAECERLYGLLNIDSEML